MKEILLKNKKNIITILVILIIGILVYNVFFKQKVDEYILRYFDPNKPIIIEEDGKYGYITAKGKVMIEPEYDNVSDFYGDYAIVKEDDECHIINKKGKIKLSEDDCNIINIQETNYWIIDGELYNKNLKKVSKDDIEVSYSYGNEGYLTFINEDKETIGVMNGKGKVIYKEDMSKDDKITLSVSSNTYNLKDTYARVCINDECGIINIKNGKVVYDFTDDYINVKSNNVFVIEDRKTYEIKESIYIEKNKIAYEVKNAELSYYSENILSIYDSEKDYNERYTYYDLKEKEELDEKPESISSIEALTGYTISSCKSDSKFGLDKGKKEILDCEYDAIRFFDEELHKYLSSKGKNYVMLKDGDDVILYDFKKKKEVEVFKDVEDIEYSSSSTFIGFVVDDEEEFIVYNLVTGKSKTFEVDSIEDFDIGSNYVMIEEDDILYYYNTKLKLIYEQEV